MVFIHDSQAKQSGQESLETDSKTWTSLGFLVFKNEGIRN